MNPRRPTPTGLKPAPSKPFSSMVIEKRDSGDGESEPSFKQDGGLIVSETLASRFLEWLDLPEDSRQLRDYRNNLRLLIGKPLDCATLHEFASQSKRKYETASRLLSFVASKRGLGLRQLAAELRECLGKKPRSGSDTYVPPDSSILEAARRLEGTRVYHVFLLLVGSGARLSTVHWLLRQGLDSSRLVCLEDRGFCRYHVDYVKGEKLQWALYSPREFWERVLEEPRLTLSYNRVQEQIAGAGVKAKHIRNWVYNKMLSLGMPEGVVEFIVGHKASSIGRRHYMNMIVQADMWYTTYLPVIPKSLKLSCTTCYEG
ncbi:hypothetical protein APE_0716.1 [Aeropyrum pernix K1]|uniref:Integrase SSV1 C-terminal domain-containing protein n=1 Tax=Aeropyrum pernix (strain ATCC 700893 / DSM 11879 / JCM 9820 / NBRC 100138 / K1) TaxID=272557 RepID=Q9YE54_AERPE|nr:hypothetical protein APE_0716.1 [Aeropyrum pernix K1]